MALMKNYHITGLVAAWIASFTFSSTSYAQEAMFKPSSSKVASSNSSIASKASQISLPAQGTLFQRQLRDSSLSGDSYLFDLLGKEVVVKRMQMPDTNSGDQLLSKAAFDKVNGEVTQARIFDADAQRTFEGTALANGTMEFVEQDIHSYICSNYDRAAPSPQIAKASPDIIENAGTVTLNQVQTLQSRPGSSRVVFIDYWGGVVTGTAWNANNNGQDIPYEPYNSEGSSSSFTQTELARMYVAWAEAADDYAPFDVNITTDVNVFNAADPLKRSRMISTPTNTVAPGAGGVAYVGVFGRSSFGRSANYLTVGWSFNNDFSTMGMTHSHEAGHQMGLSHDGDNNANPQYYSGHSNWGPIMGAPFGKDYVQWSKGDYNGATTPENDIDIIKAKLTEVSDDYGDTSASAEAINIDGAELTGIISPAGLRVDTDVFLLEQGGTSTVTIDVRSFAEGLPRGVGPNLSMLVQLRDAAGGLLKNRSPNTNPDTGFNEYGNGGFYNLKVSGGIFSSGDQDNDGVQNHLDNCPEISNVDQLNSDSDAAGDACDADDDNDSFLDATDNCPVISNTDQANNDNDANGDACDDNDDNDNFNDNVDNCPFVANNNQLNSDNDSLGNACDINDDNDNFNDNVDNCPLVSNNSQANLDGDTLGDACDADDDNDGRNDSIDNCPSIPNSNQANLDQDSFGDACDADDDGDQVNDTLDNCPRAANANQANLDGDEDGDVCDNDIDNDGVPNGADSDLANRFICADIDNDLCDDCSNGRFDTNNDGPDTDGDSICNVSDEDDDGDSINDEFDNCPITSNPDQKDSNDNGEGDLCDSANELCLPIISRKGSAYICL